MGVNDDFYGFSDKEMRHIGYRVILYGFISAFLIAICIFAGFIAGLSLAAIRTGEAYGITDYIFVVISPCLVYHAIKLLYWHLEAMCDLNAWHKLYNKQKKGR